MNGNAVVKTHIEMMPLTLLCSVCTILVCLIKIFNLDTTNAGIILVSIAWCVYLAVWIFGYVLHSVEAEQVTK